MRSGRSSREGEVDTQQVLDNIRAERCLSKHDSGEFFTRIAAAIPSSSLTNSVDALNVAVTAVEGFGGENDLYCRGEEVPAGHFTSMIRIILAKDLMYLDGDRVRASGLKKEEFENGDLEFVEDFVEDFDGSQGASIGRPGGVAWVTEESPELLDLFVADAAEVPRRLGLPFVFAEVQARGFCVSISYQREHLPESLHVPRVLDALQHAPFRPVQDCDAESGTTHPLDGGTGPGFPEAIHRSCKVQSVRVSFRKG